jgi:hypothetical protein
MESEYCYQIARADYEMKRAALVFQLRMGCETEPGGLSVSLAGDKLVIVEPCLCCNGSGNSG